MDTDNNWDTYVSDCKPLEMPEATEPSKSWRLTTEKETEKEYPKMLNSISSLLNSDTSFSF